MSLPPRILRRRLAALSAITAAGALAMAGQAAAAPSAPPNLAVAPSLDGNVTVTFGDSTGDGVGNVTGYLGSLDGGGQFAITSGAVVTVPASGTHSIEVRAIDDQAAQSDPSSAPFLSDRADPTISITPTGTLTNGWYRTLTLTPNCSDDNALPGNACPAPVVWATSSAAPQSVTMNLTDVVNRAAVPATATFNFDALKPTAPGPANLGDFIADQPTFTWFGSTDAESGMARYVVEFRVPDPDDDAVPFSPLANVADDGRLTQYTAVRDPDLRAAPLPEFTKFEWRVRAVDTAGNFKNSTIFSSTIDPTTPPPPTITGGPTGPTQNTSPTFSWDGGGDSFEWDVVKAGTTDPIRSGNGKAKEGNVQALPDGAYTFQLVQISPAGRQSEQVTRSFVIDTTAPAPPTITGRPTFPSLDQAVFTWTTEPGAYSRWSLLDATGNVVTPATDTPVNSATLPQLAEGTYSFSLQQIDGAGNVSPATVEPFTVIAPLVPPPSNTGTVTILPRLNASRLQPKAGKTLFSRTPVLRWTRGPRGTKLFNLQIFRVSPGRNGATPRVTKILSVFPHGRAFKVPRSRTRPKSCYVWRVWPYTGKEFTPKPLGVSNYCIASQKVLRAKAAAIARHRLAKQRALRSRR